MADCMEHVGLSRLVGGASETRFRFPVVSTYGPETGATCAMAVELGFLEAVDDPMRLTSPFFPSKAGGKPAWLDLRDLPVPDKLACGVCGKPSIFLLQVYAPLPSNPRAFHRTVYVFMCTNANCHERGGAEAFKVFRSQLPTANEFYEPLSSSDSETEQSEKDGTCYIKKSEAVSLVNPHQADRESLGDCSSSDAKKITPALLTGTTGDHRSTQMATSISKPIDSQNAEPSARESAFTATNDKGNKGLRGHTPTGVLASLCHVCGCLAPKKCSRCRQVCYCSHEHQIHDWKRGHKQVCCAAKAREGGDITHDLSELEYNPSLGVVFDEFEIVTEMEPEAARESKKAERSEEDRMKDYYKFIASNKYSDIAEVKRRGGKKQSSGTSESVVKDLEQSAKKEEQGDKLFKAFKERVAGEPEQVRACREGVPWPCPNSHTIIGTHLRQYSSMYPEWCALA